MRDEHHGLHVLIIPKGDDKKTADSQLHENTENSLDCKETFGFECNCAERL